MLKVALIADRFWNAHGGTERQLLTLARSLPAVGIQPTIVFLGSAGSFPALAPNIQVHTLGVMRIASPLTWLAAARLVSRLHRLGIRVAQTYFNDSSILLPPLLRARGIRVIVSRRDLGFWHTHSHKILLPVIGNICVDRYVANCDAVRDVIVRVEHVRREKIEVVFNAPSHVLRPYDRACARRTLGLTETEQVVTLVANLRPLKRIDVAIRALGLLQARTGPVHLLVAGEDGPGGKGPSHLAELQGVARECGVEDRVKFLGRVDDPSVVISAADACLLMSETEGLSNSIIEYMSLGRPVVCTDVGGNVELVTDGQTGFVVPVGDPIATAERLELLLKRADVSAKMGEKARAFALGRCSAEHMLAAHSALYHELAGACGTVAGLQP